MGTLENSFEPEILLAADIPTTLFRNVASAIAALKAGIIAVFFSNKVATIVAEDPADLVALNRDFYSPRSNAAA